VKLLLEKGAKLESKINGVRRRCHGLQDMGKRQWRSCCSRKALKLESKDKRMGADALFMGGSEWDEAVVKPVAEKGAELEFKDEAWGQTPLSYAARFGHKAVVKLLFENGAELESKDKEWGLTRCSWRY